MSSVRDTFRDREIARLKKELSEHEAHNIEVNMKMLLVRVQLDALCGGGSSKPTGRTVVHEVLFGQPPMSFKQIMEKAQAVHATLPRNIVHQALYDWRLAGRVVTTGKHQHKLYRLATQEEYDQHKKNKAV